MTDNEHPHVAASTPIGAAADVDDTQGEPMTDKQAAILRELTDSCGEPFDGNLTRRQADDRIEYLKSNAKG